MYNVFKHTALRRSLATLLAIGALSACTAIMPSKPDDIVKERATARWASLLAGEFDRAYHYTSPSFRAVVPAKNYSSRFGRAVHWLDAKVTDVKCEEDACDVTINIKSEVLLGTVKNGGTINTTIVEKWVREADDWWIYQKF